MDSKPDRFVTSVAAWVGILTDRREAATIHRMADADTETDRARRVAPTQGGMLTLTEAAALLKINRSTAYGLARSGEFPVPVKRIGRQYRVSRAALDRFINSLD